MEKESQKEVPKKYNYTPPGQSITADLTYSLSSQGTREHVDPLLVKSHIVCTIGPASNDVEVLVKLIKAGMRVARLNFSHGEYEYHAGVVQKVREASKLAGLPVAIMLDTKGPEIRTGQFVPPRKTVEFKAGDKYTWVPQAGFLGDDKSGAISWLNVAKFVRQNDRILVGDGLLAFKVEQITEEGNVACVLENSGVMGERKNVNVPGVVVDLPAVTEKDEKDIAFGVEQGVDMIAASFIRKREDVAEIRNLPGVRDNKILIISKIESQEGLDNFDGILEESDGVMVARGDLGVQIPIKKVATAQKMMISKCASVGKPVITATQMLESMIKNPRPTRAEATDVANAVFDGSDCVMLSGETAAGSYPVDAVETMVSICDQAESDIDYRLLFQKLRMNVKPPVSVVDSICSSSVKSTWDISAKLLICLTESGNTAKVVSKYRPACPILAVTADEGVVRRLLIWKGIIPLKVDSMNGTEKVLEAAFHYARDVIHAVQEGDVVLIVSGHIEGVSGATNMFQVTKVPAK